MAIKRDFKYLAILDHKSHLYTTDKNKKRKKIMKNTCNDVRVIVDGKIYFRELRFDSIYFNITIFSFFIFH
jgi:hypothetical protein